MTKCYCDRCQKEMRTMTGFFVAINDKSTKNEGRAAKYTDPRKTKWDLCEDCRDKLDQFLYGRPLKLEDW